MRRRAMLRLTAVGVAGATAGCLSGREISGDTTTMGGEDREYSVAEPFTGLSSPWGVTPLPDESGLLITEQGGQLLLGDPASGALTEIAGGPTVDARQQGGLLDVTLHPAFATTGLVYLTYTVGGADGTTTTAVGRGRLDRAVGRLDAFETIYEARPFVDSTAHYGSRAVFDAAGYLFVSVGDRQFKNFGPGHVGQTLDDDLGCVLRLEPDGSIPTDNPFASDPIASGAIYSLGHRNPQGLAIHPTTGAIWESEYGEEDGDEINVLQAGANYGWPVADNSCLYGTDEQIGQSHAERDDVVGPVFDWPCGTDGFPPSGTTFYDGEAFPDWQGDLFVAGTAGERLAHLAVDGQTVTERPSLLADRQQRLRDVAVGPRSGAIYVAVDDDPAPILKLTPGG